MKRLLKRSNAGKIDTAPIRDVKDITDPPGNKHTP